LGYARIHQALGRRDINGEQCSSFGVIERRARLTDAHVTKADNPIAIRQLCGFGAEAFVALDEREAFG
jgi:hypothetical protein